MKKNRFLLLILLTLPAAVFGQDELGQLIKGSANDAKYLAEGYVTPFMRAFGYGMNQGWYNTAAPHKFPGLDITVNVSAVYVPNTDKLFQVDNTKLTTLYLSSDVDGKAVTSTSKGNIPTFFGPNKPTTFTQKSPLPAGSFAGPTGVDLKFLPVPMAQIGIGLPKGFDLKFRYVPKIDLNNLSGGDITGNFSLFGVGVMHDVKQYIPGIKALPFDLSGFIGYTSMKLEAGFDKNNKDRIGEFSSSATTIQAVVSKKIAVLTGYAGIGYNIAKTKLAVKGSYDLNANGTSGEAGEKDPVNFDVQSSGPRMTVGLRLKLAVIAFHADYTLQKYNALTAGFGINIR